MTASSTCTSCGTGLRQAAKFCDECGAPTAVSTDAAKYRQVTVLFADVVRSMDIAAALDIERLREVMTEFLEASSAVVRRYGGGSVESTGDGVMALFGAPVAFEDHAFRACLAALAIQEEAGRVAAEVARRDGVTLQVRVGLDSGRVIAGEFGSGALGYAATGTHVGMAQRMESVAPPGAVMLSESTARLVENSATLSEPQWVHIKGTDTPVCARRLLAINPKNFQVGRVEASLVGRRWEMAALDAILDRATVGRGGVVTVIGPPGIGKSRVAREAAALAARREVEVFWTFCESHAGEIPFHVVARLLRAGSGIADLDGEAARVALRAYLPDADPQDVLLLDDLLGIADPDVPLPAIDPDARRRRLTALVNTTSLARSKPALFVIEDAHWIDPVSESMLADYLAVIPRTPTMVLITARPEYQGALARMPGAQAISLAPLAVSDTAVLLYELLGSDPSVDDLATVIVDRAAGNPFFAEEMVRELVQRGALTGAHGGYVCREDVTDLNVPATVQATIEARIDRMSGPARRTLSAASVIGGRFGAELLAALGLDAAFEELLDAELIDQVGFTPSAEFAFRHPLIRAVAYESQLKSDRAQWHRRLAAAIQQREPASVQENAALIAQHLEAAGDLHAAYEWHMRAGAWSANRDIDAARVSWERACAIADALPGEEPDRLALRIGPRTMLCVSGWQAIQENRGRFEELRELCTAAGDKLSLAIGMNGPATELLYAGRSREGARLAAEQMGLLESIGEPAPTVGLAFIAFNNWWDAGEFGTLLRWSQVVVDLAGGDPVMGAEFGFGSPLAAALAWRGVARLWLGRAGWRRDVDDARAMASRSDPTTRAMVLAWTYGLPFSHGMLRADDVALHTIEEAVRAAEGVNDPAVSVVKYTLAVGLLNGDAATRRRGVEVMTHVRDMWTRIPVPFLIPAADVWLAREKAGTGDVDGAVALLRKTVDDLHRPQRPFFGVMGSRVLVETLVGRGTAEDVAEAEQVIDRLADLRSDEGSAVVDVTVLRSRALVAGARGEDAAYRELVGRYRTTAASHGFEGHMAWAEAMLDG